VITLFVYSLKLDRNFAEIARSHNLNRKQVSDWFQEGSRLVILIGSGMFEISAFYTMLITGKSILLHHSGHCLLGNESKDHLSEGSPDFYHPCSG
jgi:hypothetical protein